MKPRITRPFRLSATVLISAAVAASAPEPTIPMAEAPVLPRRQQARRSPAEIAVFQVAGSGLRRLTTNEYADEEPEWSPDGSRILFDSNRAGSNDLYVMDADGSNVTRLTDGPAKEDHGAWSPDGSRIA